jgi:hypothetical protein
MTGELGSELVAIRLGLTESVIRQLQARGYLRIVRRTIVSMDD